jgi:hypothetical protein
MTSDVTFFLTSCKRHDLLKICLESFEEHNTYPIERGIIIEDSAQDISWCRDVLKSIPKLELINTGTRQGQIRNIDRCYWMMQTKYVFHCEDDFQFIKSGFIEPSIAILEEEPKCINVTLTPFEYEWLDPTSGHYHLLDEKRQPIDHRQFDLNGIKYWNLNNPVIGEWGLGFTFQPAVHRIEDWRKYGGYENIIQTIAPWANIFDGGQTERNLARHYNQEGYHTRIFAGPGDEAGYVISTGHLRHVPLPGHGE